MTFPISLLRWVHVLFEEISKSACKDSHGSKRNCNAYLATAPTMYKYKFNCNQSGIDLLLQQNSLDFPINTFGPFY